MTNRSLQWTIIFAFATCLCGGQSASAQLTRASGTSSTGSTTNRASASSGTGARTAATAGQTGAQSDVTGGRLTSASGNPNINAGQITGGFVGANDTSGQFVGNAAAGQQRVSQSNQQSLQTRSNSFSSDASSRNSPVKPTFVLGFDPPPALPVEEVNLQLSSSLVDVTRNIPQINGVLVASSGSGTVVLSGTVPTQRLRQLAEAFVRMEPGVREIQNDIVVGE